MREVNYLQSLSKKWWLSYFFLVMIATGGYHWLDSSGTYTFHAEFEVSSPEMNSQEDTNPYNSPVNPFKLSKTYAHVALKKVAARLTLHDLTSEAPFRKGNQSFNFYDLNKVRKEITTFLNNSEQTVLSENKLMALVMADLGYDIPGIKENLKVRWNEKAAKVSISFTSENPFLSAFVVNDLGREFARIDRQLRLSHTQTAVELFMANSHRLEVRWAGELPQAASISEIDGKEYWLSAHFPSIRFWLKEGQNLPPSISDNVYALETKQEAYLQERLRLLSKIRGWVNNLEKTNWKENSVQFRTQQQQIMNYKLKLEFLNRQVYQIDQQLQNYFEQLPDEIKNNDWIMIDEEASTNYITTNYFRDLHATTNTLRELNQNEIRFSIIADSNYIWKMPNLLVYFWMMVFGVVGLLSIDIVYDKIRLNEKS